MVSPKVVMTNLLRRGLPQLQDAVVRVSPYAQPMRHHLALGCALLVGVSGLLAAPSSAMPTPLGSAPGSDLPKDLHGTITIRVQGVSPRGRDDRTFRLTFVGGVESPGTLLAPVDVTTLDFATTYLVYDPETGEEDACAQETFLGFRGGESSSAGRGWVAASVPRIDLGKRKAVGWLSVVPGEPYGEVGTAGCGGAVEYTDVMPLVGGEQHIEASSLIGRGVDHSSQQAIASPDRVDLTYFDGAWRAKGSRTTTDTDYGTRSVTVSWDVWSKQPSTTCTVPTTKQVRGKKVAAVRKVLKKYGFTKSRVKRIGQSSVKSGRVHGLASGPDRMLGCGKSATIYVAR